MTEASRRDFLKLARAGFVYLSGALALGGLFRYLDFEPNPAPKLVFDLGPAGNFPPGSQTSIPEVPALLIRADSGFTALSLSCTHLGCIVESQGDGFTCPCHGSHFDANGSVMHGPASQALRSLRVEVNADDHVLVHLD